MAITRQVKNIEARLRSDADNFIIAIVLEVKGERLSVKGKKNWLQENFPFNL